MLLDQKSAEKWVSGALEGLRCAVIDGWPRNKPHHEELRAARDRGDRAELAMEKAVGAYEASIAALQKQVKDLGGVPAEAPALLAPAEFPGPKSPDRAERWIAISRDCKDAYDEEMDLLITCGILAKRGAGESECDEKSCPRLDAYDYADAEVEDVLDAKNGAGSDFPIGEPADKPEDKPVGTEGLK